MYPLSTPKFLEDKLKREAAAHGIRNVGAYVYGTLNKLGAMRGSKETAKGRAMDAKHAADVKAGKASGQHPHRNLGKYLHQAKKKSGS